MTALLSIIAIFASCIGLAYLATTNRMRRSARGQTAPDNRIFSGPAHALVWLPPLILIFVFGDAAATVIWAGAITMMGWAITSVLP